MICMDERQSKFPVEVVKGDQVISDGGCRKPTVPHRPRRSGNPENKANASDALICGDDHFS